MKDKKIREELENDERKRRKKIKEREKKKRKEKERGEFCWKDGRRKE